MTTEQTIYNTAIADGMPSALAVLMVAQSKLESGNYKHKFFTVGKNAFGYSYDKNSVWQLDKGGPNADNGVKIAQYKNLPDSVHEITSWIKRRQVSGQFPKDLTVIKTPAQYATFLKIGSHPYFGAPLQDYINGINTWWKKDPLGATIAKGGGLIIALLIFASLFYQR